MIATMMWVIIVIIILVLLMILVLKMTKKYQITWYWCQNIRENMVEKRVKKFGQGSPPPPFSGNAQKKTFFFSGGLPYSHHQKNVLILLQCIAMWEERKIHIVPISLWLSVLYTKFHPSKKKTYFCPRRWQWPLVRHQLAFAFTSESRPFLSSCWLSFIQIYVSKMKDDTLMLCKCW